MTKVEGARAMPVMVNRFSFPCLPGSVTTNRWHESAVMFSDATYL
jgi:hypothetical protein